MSVTNVTNVADVMVIVKKGRGRPKGKKNKVKDPNDPQVSKSTVPGKRGPGRPPGSKNKAKGEKGEVVSSTLPTISTISTASASATSKKKGPGRPPGSKNKKTLAKENSGVGTYGTVGASVSTSTSTEKRRPGRPKGSVVGKKKNNDATSTFGKKRKVTYIMKNGKEEKRKPGRPPEGAIIITKEITADGKEVVVETKMITKDPIFKNNIESKGEIQIQIQNPKDSKVKKSLHHTEHVQHAQHIAEELELIDQKSSFLTLFDSSWKRNSTNHLQELNDYIDPVSGLLMSEVKQIDYSGSFEKLLNEKFPTQEQLMEYKQMRKKRGKKSKIDISCDLAIAEEEGYLHIYEANERAKSISFVEKTQVRKLCTFQCSRCKFCTAEVEMDIDDDENKFVCPKWNDLNDDFDHRRPTYLEMPSNSFSSFSSSSKKIDYLKLYARNDVHITPEGRCIGSGRPPWEKMIVIKRRYFKSEEEKNICAVPVCKTKLDKWEFWKCDKCKRYEIDNESWFAKLARENDCKNNPAHRLLTYEEMSQYLRYLNEWEYPWDFENRDSKLKLLEELKLIPPIMNSNFKWIETSKDEYDELYEILHSKMKMSNKTRKRKKCSDKKDQKEKKKKKKKHIENIVNIENGEEL